MRVGYMETGVVREKEGTRGIGRYLWARWRDEALPVNAFLIEHPAGLCLFDVGQTARASKGGHFPRWHPFFRLARFELTATDEVAAQLRSAGIEPAEVRWVVLSHLHTDHVGGLDEFRRSELVTSRIEWERAHGLAGKMRGYLPQYWPGDLVPTLLDLDQGGFGPFPGSHDLVGDGTVVVIATPGHTPGHTSLLVRRPEGDLLLSGDLSHTRSRGGVTPEAVERYCKENGITVVGSHDDCRAADLRKVDQTV